MLKQNPMLIQKIVAERLSDKLQIIMVPTDGRNLLRFRHSAFRVLGGDIDEQPG